MKTHLGLILEKFIIEIESKVLNETIGILDTTIGWIHQQYQTPTHCRHTA